MHRSATRIHSTTALLLLVTALAVPACLLHGREGDAAQQDRVADDTAVLDALALDAMAEGLSALDDGEHELALRSFERAAVEDSAVEVSGRALAVFMQGVALNRLGRHEKARTRIEDARLTGLQHSEHAYELGWALLGSGHYDEAIEQLEAFDATHPERGQTRALLGRARFHLDDLDAAQNDLEEAIRRDPELAPTVGVFLALIARRADKPTAPREVLEPVAGEPRQGPMADLLGLYTQSGRDSRATRMGVVAPQSAFESPPAKRWRVNLTMGAGWSDNVIASADDFPVPTDISGRGSAFGRFTAAGAYDLIQTRKHLLTAGYGFATNIYENSLEQSNLLDNHGFLAYHRRFADRWFGTLRGSQRYSLIGGSSYRNRLAVTPAVGVRLANALTAEFSYSFASNNYFVPTAPVSDRDGDAQTITGSLHWRPTELPLTSRLGYAYGFNDTDGRDFDSSSSAIFVALEVPFPARIVGNLSYTYLFEHYDNPNSFTAPTPFARRRQDDVDIVSVHLSRIIRKDLADTVRVYVRYDFINNDSNVGAFDYEQSVVSAGVMIQY